MLSIPDLAVVSALALMIFGPDQLPKVARKVGHMMRDVQNTSQSFIREIERAADDHPAEPMHGYADVPQTYPEYHYDESAYHADYATGTSNGAASAPAAGAHWSQTVGGSSSGSTSPDAAASTAPPAASVHEARLSTSEPPFHHGDPPSTSGD